MIDSSEISKALSLCSGTVSTRSSLYIINILGALGYGGKMSKRNIKNFLSKALKKAKHHESRSKH